MDDSFQSFEKSQYERPDQPYDCGHACEGVRCPMGPTLKGDCQADFECVPLDKKGAFKCGRSVQQGGRCDEGPQGSVCSRAIPKCSPVASIRRRRGAFVLWCCTATLGLTMVMLGASWRDTAIKPGKLSNQHAQIIKDKSAQDRCASCHTAVEAGGLDEWTTLAFAGSHATNQASQSQRCLKCHQDKIGSAATALLPHGVPANRLAEKTVSVAKRLGFNEPRPNDLIGLKDGNVACSACHREHQGSMHDLTAMTNSQCAACHQESFRSLAVGHPEFGDWPYQRRTRIGFDHAAHQSRYFAEQKKSFACQDCHAAGTSDGIVGVVSYEQNCQSCHEAKIDQSFSEGVALLSLPMLDVRAFQAEGFSIGEWPELATGDFDGALPPLMRVLLSSDPVVRASLEQFGGDFEFTDVDPDNIDDLEAAFDIAWGLKSLIHDLSIGGEEAMRKRLRDSLGRELAPGEWRELFADMPQEVPVELQQTWFPSLAQEITAQRAGEAVPQKSVAVVTGKSRLVNGWQRDDEIFSFHYSPRGHESPFMKSWLNAISSSPRAVASEDLRAGLKQLTTSTSAGLCATCHSVDMNEQHPVVNWHARKDENDASSFVKFSHAPHTILPELNDCTACHQIKADAKTSDDYAHNDPLQFTSGFQTITKQNCTNCHAPKLAGDQCTMCHKYHVGTGLESSLSLGAAFESSSHTP